MEDSSIHFFSKTGNDKAIKSAIQDEGYRENLSIKIVSCFLLSSNFSKDFFVYNFGISSKLVLTKFSGTMNII